MVKEIIIDNQARRNYHLKFSYLTSIPFFVFLILIYPIYLGLIRLLGWLETTGIIISILIILGSIVIANYEAFLMIPINFKIENNKIFINYKKKKIDKKFDFKELDLLKVNEVRIIKSEGKIFKNVAIEFYLNDKSSKWIRLTNENIGARIIEEMNKRGIKNRQFNMFEWLAEFSSQ